MLRFIRYGLVLIWALPLGFFLPQTHRLDEALGLLVGWSVFTLVLAIMIGLAGLIGDALLGRRP
ncbi:MAG: hypothetical protein JZU52_02280 [Lamprocystis purpurea]|nr:hypothetical protein [Lamprocystis purpurea]